MYIRNTAADERPTRRLKTAQMDDYVEFNDDGVARVTRDVGEHLVNEFDTLVIESEEGRDEPTTDDTDDLETADSDMDTADAELQPSTDDEPDAELQPSADEEVDADIEETD